MSEDSVGKPKYTLKDAFKVIEEIALQKRFNTKAWIGYGEGRVVILKDESKGLDSYHVYNEGVFTFSDGKGSEQVVRIEEITEIEGC